MKQPILFIILLWAGLSVAAAADSTSKAAPAPAAAPAASPATAPAAVSDTQNATHGPAALTNALLVLKTELKDAYQQRASGKLRGIDLYSYALARIEVAYQFMIENYPGGKENKGLLEWIGSAAKQKRALEMFEACSLASEAAMIQFQQNDLENELSNITASRDSMHNELNQIYEKIAGFERDKSADLRGKLDAENEKNRKLREEAEQRFKSLESQLIKVRKDARGIIISMSDLLFGFDKADLTPDLKTSLAKIAGILSVYTRCRVSVEGHTDNIGTEAYNKDLSARRAKNVRDYLVAQSIAENRLSFVGYGFKRPIATNSTKEGRAKNRRVDLVVIDMK
jgi:outer membrane protein OmpA-like peptidoglycan-associated protein